MGEPTSDTARSVGMAAKSVRITHRNTGTVIAEGPIGWGITPFEGNFYIRRKYLKTAGFKTNFIPGLCPYKFLYVWLDLKLGNNEKVGSLGWMYFLPNPLLPFIWFRVAVPNSHPALLVEEIPANGDVAAATTQTAGRRPGR